MVTSLMQELDMTEQNIRRRLKIVGFGPIDRTRVMALRELMDRSGVMIAAISR